MTGDERVSKGIFWFTCSFDEENQCDFSETEMIVQLVPCDPSGHAVSDGGFNSKRGDAFNHKAAWPPLVRNRKDLRRHGWNYYPRGRVEVGRDKAVIYLNINILRYENFQKEIAERFHLNGLKVRVVVDHSRHYDCHGDDERIQ